MQTTYTRALQVLVTVAAGFLIAACPNGITEPDKNGTGNGNGEDPNLLSISGTITDELIYEPDGEGVTFSLTPFDMGGDPDLIWYAGQASDESEEPAASGAPGSATISFQIAAGAADDLLSVDDAFEEEVESSDPDALFDLVGMVVMEAVAEPDSIWLLMYSMITEGEELTGTFYIYADRPTTLSGGEFGAGLTLTAGWNTVYMSTDDLGTTAEASLDTPAGTFSWIVIDTANFNGNGGNGGDGPEQAM